MNATQVILLVVGIAVLVFTEIVVILWVLTRMSNLPQLKLRYPGPVDVNTPTFKAQTIMLNGVRWKKCATLSIMKDGLWLKIGGGSGSLLIPWSEFMSVKKTSIAFMPAIQFIIGEPKVVTLSVRFEVYEEMRVYLGSQAQV